jgi:hypothetical protein
LVLSFREILLQGKQTEYALLRLFHQVYVIFLDDDEESDIPASDPNLMSDSSPSIRGSGDVSVQA